jgi:hypothetical protein
MRVYFESQNWAELWEEFYLELNQNGFPKYQTLHQFAKEKARNNLQYNFLMWYLGPDTVNVMGEKDGGAWSFVDGPQHWLERRQNKGWVNKQSEEKYAALVASKIGALDKLEEVGSQVLFKNMQKALHMSDMIDEQFSPGIMLPNFNDRRNADRARLYLELQAKAHKLAIMNFEAYASSLGINVNQMDGLTQMLAGALIGKMTSTEEKKDGVQSVLKSIVESAMMKSHTYGLPLPDDINKKLIEARPNGPLVPPKKAN